MMFVGIIPILLMLVAVGLSIRALVREFTLAKRVLRPSSCAACDHEVTHTMVVSGRCPECGTLYLVAGIITPQKRLKDHAKTSGAYAACLVMGLLSAGLTAGGLAALEFLGQGAESLILIIWLTALLIIVAGLALMVHRNRRKVHRRTAQFAAASEAAHAAPVKPATPAGNTPHQPPAQSPTIHAINANRSFD